jgi:transcriptional regulator with XRE-family HTH domain
MTNTNVTIPQEVIDLAGNGRKSLARAWREHLGLTKEQVAKKMGISPAALEQIEARTAKPRKATLAKVAAALGVEVEQLCNNP